MQFSVNSGSIVSQRTHNSMTIRNWIEISRTTSLWHAHREKVGNQIVYFTHTDSFDYGDQKYQALKQQHYAANLLRGVQTDVSSFTDPSSGSIVKG
jgi:hypothetical protein